MKVKVSEGFEHNNLFKSAQLSYIYGRIVKFVLYVKALTEIGFHASSSVPWVKMSLVSRAKKSQPNTQLVIQKEGR